MTLTFVELTLYAGALFVLFLTPGPVWVALMARALSGGFHAAWPLALGVVVGDVLWPLLAVLGVSWLVTTFESFLLVLRWVACGIFLAMGGMLIRNANRAIAADSRLTRPGAWAGFLAGLAAILGNPKAVLFYMGILPGFFDLTSLTAGDVAAICTVSAAVPLVGNLALAASLGKARRLMTSPRALRRVNVVAGGLLIAVGVVLPFT
ncbi:threonine/homoserine/homoserine lactone efflux protein [Rhodovulum imhoffii]|uniref:Threonine/homoserine/homoserine lactone efflux protein n=1 Tax=Rhodovulum imhoffii TaxID=365340 RepID=A0A2T5BRS8_9RHOB|nr:LysE family translocator [Rhodovulum imhoffii]MBK5933255.1 lysine transporter LysE [Rhodovulum imhoffii]PTN01990.1 threonine/homoserine/homoserine lactone efflux protein [Rhodovulum imhoffii]